MCSGKIRIDNPELSGEASDRGEYTRHPFYGSRKMAVFLKAAGHDIKHKRVSGLICNIGMLGVASGTNTSRSLPEHKVYP
jgi:putative transposase